MRWEERLGQEHGLNRIVGSGMCDCWSGDTEICLFKGEISMISVIVPVHNGEKTLRRCVDSILISTEKDIEVILVENGSTDRTLDICRLYSDKYNNVKTVVFFCQKKSSKTGTNKFYFFFYFNLLILLKSFA